jgi:hypothetical protein
MNTPSFPLQSFFIAGLLGAAFFMGGCATTYIKPEATTNPAPREKFSAFQHFEIRPIQVAAAYAENEANQRAEKKIQENLNLRIEPMIDAWNTASAGTEPGRTLVIEPEITQIKFINGSARVWAGAWAGSSAVIMRVTYRDKDSGAVIARPEFYQRAAAMGGAWSFGATDNNMLVRIAILVSDYTEKNYAEAVGGPTGAEEEP